MLTGVPRYSVIAITKVSVVRENVRIRGVIILVGENRNTNSSLGGIQICISVKTCSIADHICLCTCKP